jgi:hypothetical protein
MSKKNNLTLVGLNNQDNDLFGGFGDDHLTGGTNAVSFTTTQNILVGDAQNMLAFEKGGGDTLIGGNSSTDDPTCSKPTWSIFFLVTRRRGCSTLPVAARIL